MKYIGVVLYIYLPLVVFAGSSQTSPNPYDSNFKVLLISFICILADSQLFI